MSSTNYLILNNDDLLFENNFAENGGSIYLYNGSQILINGSLSEKSRFINCSASEFGGAIFAAKVELSIINCYFANQSSLFDGGTIY